MAEQEIDVFSITSHGEVYTEGYSQEVYDEDRRHGVSVENASHWFCMELENEEEARKELRQLGFTDAEINQAKERDN